MSGIKVKNDIRVIPKPWGQEELLEKNDAYMVKRLTMLKGHQCSYQYHEFKRETIYVLSGDLMIIGEHDTKVLSPGQSLTLQPFEKHRMRAETTDCIYLEASTPQIEDVVRIEDDYKRV